LEGLIPARLSRTLAGLALASAAEAFAAFAEDVPFVTTPDRVTMEMLRLAGVGPGDFVIDLGSGDGRIVITAARHFGARALGVEIVPDLVRRSRENAARAGVAARAQFLQQDLFLTDLAPATAVTLYLLPEVNLQLRPRLLQLRPGTRIVSHDWDMGEWLPERTLRLEVPEKKVGVAKSSLVHLWIVPARLAGAWCGDRRQRGTQLTFDQQFQFVRGALSGAATGLEFTARIEGRRLATPTGAADYLEMKLDGAHLGVIRARGAFSRLQGARFQRREGQVCE
jgi:SAM-dependent methyltransferase